MSNDNPLVIREGKEFVPAPEGEHNAICIDVVDLGLQMTPWGEKPKIRIVWELPECPMEDGRPFIVNNRYSPTLDERSTLRKHLQLWRGKMFSQDELQGFNLESIIGSCCRLIIQHRPNPKGKIFANIETILKASKQVKSAGKYVRVKDREDKDHRPKHRMVDTSKEGNQDHPEKDDDDIPF